MGVQGLQRTLSQVGNPIDLIQAAKQQSQPLILLVDFYAFTFYISETFTSCDPDGDLLLDTDPLRRYEFSELQKLRAIVWVYVEVLKLHNIHVEFIGDGAYKLGTEEGDAKRQEWERRAKGRFEVNEQIEAAFLSHEATWARAIYSEARSNCVLPPMFTSQIQHTIRAAGLPIWFCDGEADKLIAEISRRRSSKSSNPLSNLAPIFAILSNDSDFSLMSGCNLLLANLFDQKRQLVSSVSRILQHNRRHLLDPTFTKFIIDKNNPSHQLSSLVGHVFSPDVVARSFKISVDMLPEVSILAGNDFTRGFIFKHRLKQFSGRVDVAAEELRALQQQLKRPSRVEDIQAVRNALQRDSEFKQAVVFSRTFYGYESKDQFLNSDIAPRELEEYVHFRLSVEKNPNYRLQCGHEDDKSLLRRYCCWGVFPRFILQATESKTYWLQSKLEFVKSLGFGIDDAFVDFRRYLYAVLGMTPQTAITEYGRAKNNLCAVVPQHPEAIPNSLTWSAVRKLSVTDPMAYRKALAEILSTVIQASNPTFQPISPNTSNLGGMYLSLLSSLRFEDSTAALLSHELDSVILMSIICVMRVSSDAKLTELELEMIEKFRIHQSTIDVAIQQLRNSGYTEKDDPIGFMNGYESHKVAPRYGSLNGLVCGFRSLVVLGWIQLTWYYIVDLLSLFYGVATGLRSMPSFALILNGDVYRWIYAAGALDWKSEKSTHQSSPVSIFEESVPIEVSACTIRQMQFVRALRSVLLQTSEVRGIQKMFCVQKVHG